MPQLEQDRLIRKEVALATVREIERPEQFIGVSQLAPMRSVQSDEVIFSYVAPDTSGLAPARAEDAESEMATKDDLSGAGSASVVDWAIKDHYDPSDVTRYREITRMAELAQGGNFPLTINSMTEDWNAKVTRDTNRRRRSLDNRLEWLAVNGAFNGKIEYNDGKLAFTVDYGRPVDQQDQAPTNGVWSAAASDPIDDIEEMNDFMYDTHNVRLTRAWASRKAVRQLVNSDKFIQRAGLAAAVVGSSKDLKYSIPNWGVDAAVAVIEAATGVQFSIYEGTYKTRELGTKTWNINRFAAEEQVLFLPAAEDMADVSEFGFGATLTSPHAEGNFTPGFYEWERSTVDPWGQDMGTGIKAFPVYPHLEYSYVMDVL